MKLNSEPVLTNGNNNNNNNNKCERKKVVKSKQ
jgi:hypothetical protein